MAATAAKKAAKAETRSFTMHKNLLVDVITRQAGTLMKGVTEAVMNSIDAGAKSVVVTVAKKVVVIEDDGKGFKSREEIESYFECFGNPHSAEENKIYGTFRMGRGQGFAFGRNTWRTGEFEMVVDIRKDGLDYKLKSGLDHHPGCRIEIELYDELGGWMIQSTVDEIKASVHYVPTKVIVNGTQVSTPVDEVDWDHEEEDFVVNIRDTQQMKVYNLGVFVRTYPAGQFGCGGVIVTKKPLGLNFARNDVLVSSCKLWPKIKEFIGGTVDKVSKKKPLTEAARIRLADRMREGTLSGQEAWEAPVFRDGMKRWWSLEKINDSRRQYKCVSTHKDHGGRADRLMQHKLALVLDSSWFEERFGVSTWETLREKVIDPIAEEVGETWDVKYRDFDEISEGFDETFTLVPKAEWNPIEALVLATLETCSINLVYSARAEGSVRNTRRIILGVSGSANAWTDGDTYIAFNRDFIKACGVDVKGWVKLNNTLIHEYCHGEQTSATHDHSPEFYELHHDLVKTHLSDLVDRALSGYANRARVAGRKLTKQQLVEADTQAATDKITQQLEGKA